MTEPNGVNRRSKLPYDWEVRRIQRRRRLWRIVAASLVFFVAELAYLLFTHPA